MPFDGRTIETHPDIIICDGAIEALRRYGWVKGGIGNERTGFCIIGALDYAQRVTLSRRRLNGVDEQHRDLIKPLLERRANAHSIPHYNDCIATRRADAIRFLRSLRNAIQKKLLHGA